MNDNIEPDDGIDIVITSVNPTDSEWRESFITNNNIDNPEDNCRYRYFNTLQYFFRGIETNMPWFRRVHLVVSQPSQVPKWLNKDNDRLHIVYHKDYIPEELLPTFNTNQVELFFYKIEGLSERFIYFNDDTFPINPLEPKDFFTYDGCARMSLKPRKFRPETNYTKMLYNGIKLLKEVYPNYNGFDIDHSLYNFIKSFFAEVVELYWDTIMERFSKSRMRTTDDLTLQLVRDYQAMEGWAAPSIFKWRYVGLTDGMSISQNKDVQLICFNDTGDLKNDYKRIESEIVHFLRGSLPNKSSFEL